MQGGEGCGGSREGPLTRGHLKQGREGAVWLLKAECSSRGMARAKALSCVWRDGGVVRRLGGWRGTATSFLGWGRQWGAQVWVRAPPRSSV